MPMPVMVLLWMSWFAQGPAVPIIDGRIAAEEWSGASKQSLTGGGDLYLLVRGDVLYVGVRGPAAGLASLCVAAGDRVRILHASAAVGEAAYECDGRTWMRRTEFSWALRDAPLGGPTDADRAAFVEKYGWLATGSASGAPEREFRIPRAAIGVTFLSTKGGMAVSYWPETIDDDCRTPAVLMGRVPATATFHPETWHGLGRRLDPGHLAGRAHDVELALEPDADPAGKTFQEAMFSPCGHPRSHRRRRQTAEINSPCLRSRAILMAHLSPSN